MTKYIEDAWALRDAAPSLGSDLNPLGVWVGPEVGVAVIGALLSDQIPILLSSVHHWC